jgi:AcrR family transcriptional regulator
MSTTAPPRPKPGGKRERTRAALIAATLDVVAEKGFAAASLDAIAARAGMSRGAIYSNFAGRGELLLAAMGSKGLTLAPAYTPGGSFRDHLRAMARALVAALPQARGEAKFMAEFQLYALADPELRRDIAAGYAGAFAQVADFLAEQHAAELLLPPRQMAVAMQAVALGLMCQSLLTPDEVTAEVVIATIEAFADGATKPAA